MSAAWQIYDGTRQVATLSADAVSAVFSPDGRRLATWSWDNTILPVTTYTRPTEMYTPNPMVVTALAISDDGEQVAAALANGDIYLWDARAR